MRIISTLSSSSFVFLLSSLLVSLLFLHLTCFVSLAEAFIIVRPLSFTTFVSDDDGDNINVNVITRLSPMIRLQKTTRSSTPTISLASSSRRRSTSSRKKRVVLQFHRNNDNNDDDNNNNKNDNNNGYSFDNRVDTVATETTATNINIDKGNDKVNNKGGLFFNGIKNVANDTVSKVKQGGSGMLSVANATTSRLAGLAEKGGSNVVSVVTATSAQLSKIAQKGSQSVTSVATVATNGFLDFVDRGSTTIVAAANATTNSASDVVRWIDDQARAGATAANAKTEAVVLSFTGKREYKFGDISKELLRRVATTELALNDILLLLKIMLAIGASFGPLAKALPVTVLLEMLNVSIERQIGGKVLEVLAGSLDDRFSAAFSNDDKFQLGDAVKRSALTGILKFTGKDSYQGGDIERAVTSNETKNKSDRQNQNNNDDDDNNNNNDNNNNLPTKEQTLQIRLGPEFEEWDEKFRQTNPDLELAGIMDPKTLDMKVANELAEEGILVTPAESSSSSSLSSSPSKYCVFCGTKLPGVALYCSSCGERQP